jgi:hypothetical protein
LGPYFLPLDFLLELDERLDDDFLADRWELELLCELPDFFCGMSFSL